MNNYIHGTNMTYRWNNDGSTINEARVNYDNKNTATIIEQSMAYSE